MLTRPQISIIGPGRLGTALAMLASQAGYKLAAIGGRNLAIAYELCSQLDEGVLAAKPQEAAQRGDLILLTISDGAIEAVCDQLHQCGAFRAQTSVIHCSGAFGSNILASAQASGCFVASCHPLQTFPSAHAAVAAMPGTYWYNEGDAPAITMMGEFITAIGGVPVAIKSEQKALYHAAAVMACNYLTTLMDAALTAGQAAELNREDFWKGLEPLVQTTLSNISRLGPAEALTGPISRGDGLTVVRHVHCLQQYAPELLSTYRALGIRTVDLALRKGTIDESRAEVLRDQLQ